MIKVCNCRDEALNISPFSRLGTIAPSNGLYPDVYARIPWIPNWLDLNVMVPFIATVIVLAVGILVICVAYSRRRGDDAGRNSKDVYCMLSTTQKNHFVRLGH